jgi:hypothetical protein
MDFGCGKDLHTGSARRADALSRRRDHLNGIAALASVQGGNERLPALPHGLARFNGLVEHELVSLWLLATARSCSPARLDGHQGSAFDATSGLRSDPFLLIASIVSSSLEHSEVTSLLSAEANGADTYEQGSDVRPAPSRYDSRDSRRRGAQRTSSLFPLIGSSYSPGSLAGFQRGVARIEAGIVHCSEIVGAVPAEVKWTRGSPERCSFTGQGPGAPSSTDRSSVRHRFDAALLPPVAKSRLPAPPDAALSRLFVQQLPLPGLPACSAAVREQLRLVRRVPSLHCQPSPGRIPQSTNAGMYSSYSTVCRNLRRG